MLLMSSAQLALWGQPSVPIGGGGSGGRDTMAGRGEYVMLRRLLLLLTFLTLATGCAPSGVTASSQATGTTSAAEQPREFSSAPPLPQGSPSAALTPSAADDATPAAGTEQRAVEWAQAACGDAGFDAARGFGQISEVIDAVPTTVQSLREWNRERVVDQGGPDVVSTLFDGASAAFSSTATEAFVAVCTFAGSNFEFPRPPTQTGEYDLLTLAVPEDGEYEVVAASISEIAGELSDQSRPAAPSAAPPTFAPTSASAHDGPSR